MSIEDDKLTRKLGCLIRIGQVITTDPEKHTVRVLFEAENELSYDLPVLVHNTYANHDYAMPDVGDDVLCLFLPEGPEDGFVLGSFYAGEVTPPTTNEDIRCVQFQDDTMVSYNRASHELDIKIGQTSIHADQEKLNINTNTSIALNTNGDISINATGKVSINGSNVGIN